MKYFLGLFFGALLVPTISLAAVRINEIAWMGTTASQYSEWLELYNDGDEAVSLAGWQLYKTGNELFFTLSKSIAAKGYLLVERTTASAPDAVPGIDDESGTFSGGGLKNSGEDITLEDKEGTVIDTLPFANAWPAGDAKTKETMQWDGSQWITAAGTPDAPNASAPVVSTPVVVTQSADTTDEEQIQTPVTSTATVAATPVSVQQTVQVQPSITKTVVPDTPDPSTMTIPATGNTVTATTAKIPAAAVKKASVSVKTKSTSKKSVTVGTPTVDAQSNEIDADQLEASADIPKENNRNKVIIFGAVAFIGMALFLLLIRLKARQE